MATVGAPTPESNIAPPDIQNDHHKVDHITSLQEGIDGLSLSLFEALRGLRDAVAPESGNLGGMNANGDGANNSPTESSENDFGAQRRHSPSAWTSLAPRGEERHCESGPRAGRDRAQMRERLGAWVAEAIVFRL